MSEQQELTDTESVAVLAEHVKAAHRSFPTGVTVVTVASGGDVFGLAVNAFSSISLEPPLIMVAVKGTSSTYPTLFRENQIAVNILSAEQADMAGSFARSGGNKFADIDWHAGDNGSPLLDNASAFFELEIQYRIPAYTHTIFIGKVTRAGSTGKPPLVYLDSKFFRSDQLVPIPRS
ncbi:flavin reductase family protein [Arthrobacter sp. Cr_A7]|uniref:flavin reductase family protein n=1 Tax=Arthrobacter sp. Cr_A7 TaxID=3031017 RepID=UPI0023D9CBB1|nr:flavin reductase family protein [Arthrobacter sp. Cr_A7]MDF2050425.1 flavin reductase family protein [Arthrobacter sp. Cr_A7]